MTLQVSTMLYCTDVMKNNNAVKSQSFVLVYFVDCSTEMNSDLLVSSTSAVYNSFGEFYCANNGVLFLAGTGNSTTNETVCNATAQWSRQEKINCYTGR